MIKELNIKDFIEALFDMVNQFAYTSGNTEEHDDEKLITGGLSSLEYAFELLGLEENITRRQLREKYEEVLRSIKEQKP
jgi:hypothetical protein